MAIAAALKPYLSETTKQIFRMLILKWKRGFTSQWKVLVEYEAKMFRLGGAVRTFLSQLNGKKLFRVGHKRAYEALVTYLFESAVKMLQFFLGQLSATNE